MTEPKHIQRPPSGIFDRQANASDRKRREVADHAAREEMQAGVDIGDLTARVTKLEFHQNESDNTVVKLVSDLVAVLRIEVASVATNNKQMGDVFEMLVTKHEFMPVVKTVDRIWIGICLFFGCIVVGMAAALGMWWMVKLTGA